MKFSGLPGNDRHGRMQISRLKICRIETMGLKYCRPLPFSAGMRSASVSFFGFDVIAPNSPTLCLPQQLDGALGQRIALVPPALPADVGVHVVGFEADRVEHANRLRQNLVANAVSRHGYDRMFRHECKLLSETALKGHGFSRAVQH